MAIELTPQNPLRPIPPSRSISLAWLLLAGMASAGCGEDPQPESPRKSPKANSESASTLNPVSLQGYKGQKASAGVLKSAARADASTTEWFTEAFAEEAKGELKEFMHKVAAPAAGTQIEPHLTMEFTGSSPWCPSKLEQSSDDGTLMVAHGTEFSEKLLSRDQIGEANRELQAQFGWDEGERLKKEVELHSKAKIYETNRVPGHEGRMLTRALVILYGPTKAGETLTIEMDWNIEWLVHNGDDPSKMTTQIRAIELNSHTQILNRSQPLFAEVTGHVFQDVPRFDNEFRIGTGEYHHHIDLMDENIFAGQIGIAVGDVDEDGLEDMFIPQQGGHPNRLLKHMPDGTLKDISEGSGLNLLEGCQSALILDFDNDGHVDIALARHSSLVVGYGDGSGKFELMRPVAEGLDKIKSIAAADFDKDGDLDIYACMYSKEGPLGTIPVPYQDAINGPPNVLWLNTPDKVRPRERWLNVTEKFGLNHNNNKFSYGAVWEDFDSDGDLDLYVVNDFGRNNFYRNDDGHFSDVADEIGVSDMAAGMGVSVGDVDSDGDLDIYVTNMWSSAGRRITSQKEQFLPGATPERKQELVRHARGNTLLLNDGDGTFTDATESSGAMNAGWAWGAMMLDINNNGLLDIYSPNGFITGALSADT